MRIFSAVIITLLLSVVAYHSDAQAAVQCGASFDGARYRTHNGFCSGGDGRLYASLPPEFCGPMWDWSHENPPPPAPPFFPLCSFQATIPGSISGQHYLASYKSNSGAPAHDWPIIAITGGDPCWSAARSAGGNGYVIGLAPAGCNVCVEPEVWDDVAKRCVAPDCDDGEIWDDEISACRAECSSEDEYYHYASSSCVAKCPTGLSSPHRPISNKPTIGTLVTSTVNGCPVDHHYYCVPDVSPGGYYHGDQYTGKVCINWFTYKQEMVEYDVISQEQYCAETGACEGYLGEPEPAVISGFADDAALAAEFIRFAETAAINIEETKFLCLAGVYRLITTINGTVDDVEFFGACSKQDEDFTPPGPSQNEYDARLEAKVDDIKQKADDSKTILDAIKDLADDIKGMTTQVASSLGITTGEGEDPGEGGEFEGPEGDSYEVRYPGGVGDAMDDVGFSAGPLGALKDAALLDLVGVDYVACPSWTFVAPFIGEFEFNPPCQIWDLLAAMVLVMATLGAWVIIFG